MDVVTISVISCLQGESRVSRNEVVSWFFQHLAADMGTCGSLLRRQDQCVCKGEGLEYIYVRENCMCVYMEAPPPLAEAWGA